MDLAAGRIYVRRSVWNGKEVTVKTRRGNRTSVSIRARCDVDGAPWRTYVRPRVPIAEGTPFAKSNVRRKLNQIITKLGLATGGLYAFGPGKGSMLRSNMFRMTL